LVALSLVASGCGEKTPTAAPEIGTQGGTSGQLALTRQADTVDVDQSVQLTAIIPSAPGNVASSVSWASSDPNVAIVTQNGVLFALKSGRTIVTATSRGQSSATTVTVRPSVREVAFDSDSLAISVSQSVKLPYRVKDSDGNDVDLSTRKVEWITSDAQVVPLTGDATVTGRAIGSADLLLRVDAKEATTRVKVMAKPVATVVVSPTSLKIGTTQSATLAVTTYDVQGNVLTGRSLTYGSSDQTIAYVNSNGVVTGVANGQATITVTADGRRSTTVPVTVGAGPTNPTVPVALVAVTLNASSLTAGQSTQANAVTKDASGNVLTGRTIVWTTSDPAVASIDGAGVITSLKAGSATITATSEGNTGTAALAVTPSPTAPAPVASMTLSVSPTLTIGQSTQAVVTLKDSSGNVLTGRTVTWVSTDASIVSVSSSGSVTALKAGGVTISASVSGGASASAVVSAVAPPTAVRNITLAAGTTQLKIGQLTQITAVVRDANGNVMSGVPVTFTSSPSTVATVSGGGVVAGVNVGSATIYAKADTVTRSLGMTVIDSTTASAAPPPPPPPPAPSGIAILPGQSIQAQVDANPAGTTFILKSGTHVRQDVVPKDGDVFLGEAGTVLDGQTVTTFAFRGWNGSRWINSVTVRNLKIVNYAPPAQNGAIWGGDDLAGSTNAWILDSLDVSYSTNLGVRVGNHMSVLRSVLHHNGTINIGGVGRGVLVDGIESSYGNNGCLKDPGFESGGSKFVMTDSLVVRNSFFHHNCGVGLWLDINNKNYVLESNRVEDNVREGICLEISFNGIVRNNAVARNGWPTDPYRANGWLWDAGIGIHESDGVEVYGNTLTENFNGIAIVQQRRDATTGDVYAPTGGYLAQNAYVHDNTLYQRNGGGSGAANDLGDTATFLTRNNRWANNTYYVGTNARPFAWMNGWRTTTEWRAYNEDSTGSFNP
jgi:parallel beta-helix repeat protein